MKNRLSKRLKDPITFKTLNELKEGVFYMSQGKGIYCICIDWEIVRNKEDYQKNKYLIDTFLVDEGYLIKKHQPYKLDVTLKESPAPWDDDTTQSYKKKRVFILIYDIEIFTP
ncbi:MAG: hypothetical protein VX762_01030 [Bacteroidota bacterium]|nr:hypothetical protein [Bacteroidota bacterium]